MLSSVTRAGLALLALASLSASVWSQSGVYLYALRDNGATFVNGTQLEKAPSSYVSGDSETPGEERYQDLAVVGKDRYQLRVDGRVQKNGVKAHQLPFDVNAPAPAPWWFRMHVDAEGVVYAVRTDGMVARNGQVISQFEGSAFADLTTVPASVEGAPDDVYVLRIDGSIYRQDEAKNGFKFDHDREPDNPEPDGNPFDVSVQWLHLTYDASGDRLLAMRGDGTIYSVAPSLFAPVPDEGAAPGDGDPPAPPNGVLEAELPFTTSFYVDIALREPAEPDPGVLPSDWFTVRDDGRVFSSTLAPPGPDGDWEWVVDLPGDAVTSSVYVSIAVSADDFFAMRYNGLTYSANYYEAQDKELLQVKGTNLIRMAMSTSPPDGANFKNRPPKAAIYRTKLVTDEAVTIPVMLSDYDLPTDQIEITPELDEFGDFPKLPGGVWDAEARTVTFPGSAEKGNFRFRVFADDGSGKKPKRFNFPVKVFPPDAKPDKNRPPVPTTISKILAFIDQELSFPLLATDKDVGDTLTFEVVDLKGKDIFDPEYGAVFDDVTNTVTWTPSFEHLGKHRAVFFIYDDGDPQKKRKLNVKIEVASQLVLEVDDDEK